MIDKNFFILSIINDKNIFMFKDQPPGRNSAGLFCTFTKMIVLLWLSLKMKFPVNIPFIHFESIKFTNCNNWY